MGSMMKRPNCLFPFCEIDKTVYNCDFDVGTLHNPRGNSLLVDEWVSQFLAWTDE